MKTSTKAAKAARKTAADREAKGLPPTKAKKAKGAPAAKPAAKPAKAAPNAAKKPASAERPDGLRAGSKMATAIDMVCAKRGATCAEIAEALGWEVLNSSTLKRYCSAARVKLREDDGEKPSRFFGTARAYSRA
jgi:hypothetical protein